MVKKKPLRLLVVGATWPPQTFLGRLMRGLAESGVVVSLAFNQKPDQDWFFRSGLRSFLTRSWTGPRALRLLWLAWLAVRALAKSPRDTARYLRRSRWTDWSTLVWMARRSGPGTGPGTSGLKFDFLHTT